MVAANMPEENTKTANVKLAVGWSAVVLAIVGGITGGMSWVANNVAKPLTAKVIEAYDFQQQNAAANTEILESVRDGIDTLNEHYNADLRETHTLQREQIDAQNKTAEVIEKKGMP